MAPRGNVLERDLHSSARMLFSDRSLLTMAHGIALSSAALVGLAASLFAMVVLRAGQRQSGPTSRQARLLIGLLCVSTAALWLAVLAGTYGVFPMYRVTPPKDTADLAAYPRALLLAGPGTAWLHSFAMETKEHVPWIAAMLATAGTFVVWLDPIRALRDRSMFRASVVLVTISLVLASWTGLLGILVNKVAPLQ
jgi:hypothetical protein